MKKLFKNKYFIIALTVLVLGGGGFAVIKYQQNKFKKQDEEKTEEKKDEENKEEKEEKTEKTDNPPKVETDDLNSDNQTTPEVTGTPAVLGDTSLTVYLNNDGTINPYFYMPPGNYSVQKLVGGNWQDIVTNKSYPGHGGLFANPISVGEDNVNYRVLKIEGNNVSAISKTFVVKRVDVGSGGGIYTYN